MSGLLEKLLAHPLTRGAHLDDPRTTALRGQIIRGKPFLRRIYDEWYTLIARSIPPESQIPGRVLELGSGAGYMRDFVPELITSDLLPCPGVDLVLNGQSLPLADQSLRAIVMTNVFHHLPSSRQFIAEAARTVRTGGVVAMIEPWYSRWSNFIYTKLHHEPFCPDAAAWEFPDTGPLSGANEALAWVVFQRDAAAFEKEFPQWRIEKTKPMMPLRYLLSGGVSLRSLMPSFMFKPLKVADELLASRAAMFAHIILRRSDVA